MSISDAVAALDDLADGRTPDWIRLAMGVTALRARCGPESEGRSVFVQAVEVLTLAPQVFAGEGDLGQVTRMRAAAVTLRERLVHVETPMIEPTDQVESAWRMVELQAQRVVGALDVRAWPATLAPDFHFLVVSMRRLRRSVAMLVARASTDASLHRALVRFDTAVPWLSRLPDIGEHLDNPTRHRPQAALAVDLMAVEGARRHIVRWGAWTLDVDLATQACVELRSCVAELLQ